MGGLGNVREPATVYFVMGICGSGKSTIAARLADELGIEFLDADDFHPPANVEKMRSGQALDDADRAPWLARLNEALTARAGAGESVALACSALKRRYRDVLQRDLRRYRWIYLKGDRDLILDRMSQRSDHFMPSELVDSQLAALEEPDDAVVGDIRLSKRELVEKLLSELETKNRL
ncbi:gluconokinase [Pelagicoccus sp. SDUM812003]|uniref:gluconokinase n=1 Tax=Pelagicoccus sp. SDUM812003 TaxID=3041267 RepID=UPI00281064BF|nr:gluconokinase [Pelagicoccus sp. SDUM812003]MDQ8205140.1 gluconokinase [Pelagicoccus sp. SDUM812003]